jgi:hypothetical protein
MGPGRGNPAAAHPLTVGEFLLLIEEYAAKAREVWATEKKPEGRTLHIIRKGAGIAVKRHGTARGSPALTSSALPGRRQGGPSGPPFSFQG